MGDDFTVLNVAENSHTLKPLLYKITGTWGNHEGSILLWGLILALCGGAVAAFGRGLPSALRARVIGVLGGSFGRVPAVLPARQQPVHPAVAAAARRAGHEPAAAGPRPRLPSADPLLRAMSASRCRSPSPSPPCSRAGSTPPGAAGCGPGRWRSWCLLTGGIALGCWWAYYELGWGGFWFWDPVENACLLPWLTGTALLHSAIVVEKREALKIWTVLLAIGTFSLSLSGTFLVRSGILNSVHAFANDPARGVFILGLLGASSSAAACCCSRCGRRCWRRAGCSRRCRARARWC